MKQQELPHGVYIPYNSNGIVRIVAKDRMRKVFVAEANEPEHICGVARRVGYTGKSDDALAIYRLKVTYDGSSSSIMFPTFFVVDGGIFVEYEEWCRTNKTTESIHTESSEKMLQRN
jgi:hypothetical protein